MSRLSRYLVMQFLRDAIALFLVAATLVWLTNMLQLFDLVTAKSQSMFTLAGQAFLSTPPLAREILYICMAIGMARAFTALQDSHELHTIHATNRVRSIWGALVAFSLIGVIFVQFLAHWAEPISRLTAARWSAEIAAELVGENLVPGRFTEISDGVVVRIGPRLLDGTITDFFADDTRNETRRTYFAETAVIVSLDEGYQISLRDGRLETQPPDDQYSEIAFSRYEIAVANLTETDRVNRGIDRRSTWELLQRGQVGSGAVTLIQKRFVEGLRLVAALALVAAFLMYPNASRGKRLLPAELVILLFCFGERALSNALAFGSSAGMYAGPFLMAAVAIVVYVARLLASRKTRGAALA
ncbi:LptF/LptG family permease [bacterium]|nr:LptF/LptG family permease [bacterium]